MLAIVVCGETAAAAAYSRAVANAAAVAHSPARVAAVVQVAHCSDLASATATAASAGASTVLVVGSAVGVRAVAAASRVESVLLEAALRDGAPIIVPAVNAFVDDGAVPRRESEQKEAGNALARRVRAAEEARDALKAAFSGAATGEAAPASASQRALAPRRATPPAPVAAVPPSPPKATSPVSAAPSTPPAAVSPPPAPVRQSGSPQQRDSRPASAASAPFGTTENAGTAASEHPVRGKKRMGVDPGAESSDAPFATGGAGGAASGSSSSQMMRATFLLQTLKQRLLAHGARGIVGLGRKFRIMDDDGSGTLHLAEFTKALTELDTKLSTEDVKVLFNYFDHDGSGSVSFDEFLVGVRGELSERRLKLVQKAFSILDADGSGSVELDDIIARYDASAHPEVVSGKRTKAEVLRDFLDTFDAGEKDGKVTPSEFQRYYANVSASIDDDDYFELMIRNAWHISGGEGWSANTANRRVLVLHADGTQSVEEVENDLGLGSDLVKIKAALIKQGVTDVVRVSLTGELDTTVPASATRKRPGTSASAPFGTTDNAGVVENAGHVRSKKHVGKISTNESADSPFAPIDATSAPAAAGGAGAPVSSTNGGAAASGADAELVRVNQLLAVLREQLMAHGARGIVGLGRKFRIIDDDGSGQLNLAEFTKALHETDTRLSTDDIQVLFKYFDHDGSGSLSFDEFLVGVRGELNERRRKMVEAAFRVLDKDGSGSVGLDDIMSAYDASQHPDVVSGKRSKADVLREFLDTFDGGEKDGLVTPAEFQRYYANVSASVDDDDYFELMIRNAWHISGGEGWSANTANRRVLVLHADGTQTVEEVQNDLGLGNDLVKIKSALIKQGIPDVVRVSLTGELDTTVPATSARPTPKADDDDGAASVSSGRRRVGKHSVTSSSIVFG